MRLLIGPANSAGQGYAWARVAERHSPGVAATCFALANRFDFPSDYSVTPKVFTSQAWRLAHRRYVLGSYTHVIIESQRPLFAPPRGRNVDAELPDYARAGIAVALLSHGSDARVPSRHAEREPFSPFRETDWETLPHLEEIARAGARLLNEFPGHVLVSTPDLLDDIPDAAWCPVIVDIERWGGRPTALERVRPVVVHVPSHSHIKGSAIIDPVLSRLDDAGLIEYRRMEGLTSGQMIAAYHDADVVVDQIRLGSYGVAACEGMAAGRIVVGHVASDIRNRVLARTGVGVPIVQADPQTLEDVVRDIAARPDAYLPVAQEGVDFVRTVHDGRMSADALTPFLAGAPR